MTASVAVAAERKEAVKPTKPVVLAIGSPLTVSSEPRSTTRRPAYELDSQSTLVLQRLVKNADVFTLNVKTKERQKRFLKFLEDPENEKPQGIAVTVYDQNLEETRDFVNEVLRRCPRIGIYLGGPSLNTRPNDEYPAAEFMLHYFKADAVFVGSGVRHFDEYLRIVNDSNMTLEEKKLALSKFKTAAFRLGGEVIKPEKFERSELTQEEVDTPINWEEMIGSIDEKGILHLNSSTGCDYGCFFCSIGAKFRGMNGKTLAREIQRGLDYFNKEGIRVTKIQFSDDDFLQDKKRFLEYAQEFERLGLQKRLVVQLIQSNPASFLKRVRTAGANYNALDGELLAAMKRIKINGVYLGTDNFSFAERENLGKPKISDEQLETVIAALNRRRIVQIHFLIALSHKTTLDSFTENLTGTLRLLARYSKTMHVDELNPLIAQHGSAIGRREFKRLHEEGEELDKWCHVAETPEGKKLYYLRVRPMFSNEIAGFWGSLRASGKTKIRPGKTTVADTAQAFQKFLKHQPPSEANASRLRSLKKALAEWKRVE